MNQESQASTHASYVVAYDITKQGKPFTEGEFFKNLMLKADVVCPVRKGAIQNVGFAWMTITCGEEVSNDQLQSNVQKFVSVSLTLEESINIGSNAPLLIFVHGERNDFDFQVSEELLAQVSLKEWTRGCDIFEAICDATDQSNLFA